MPTKIETLPADRYDALIAELRGLAAKPTLRQIQDVAQKFGLSISPDSASTFRRGAYARALERINAGRETREALCAAAGAGVHPLDAIEEVVIAELQDHLTEAETIDIKFVVDQLTKLRASISMREKSRREQIELESKLRESEQKIAAAEQQAKIRNEQIARLVVEREEREAKNAQAKAALTAVAKKGGITKETLARIEEAAGLL